MIREVEDSLALAASLVSRRNGLVQQAESGDHAMNAELRQLSGKRLSPQEQAFLRESRKLYQGALRAAAAGQTEAAQCGFQALHTLVDEAGVGDEAVLLCRAFGLQAEAYLEARLKEWDKALERLLEALRCSTTLEVTCGYAIMRFHRIHIIENVSRLLIRKGEWERAAECMGCLLSYLCGMRADLPFPGQWDWNAANLRPDLIRAKFFPSQQSWRCWLLATRIRPHFGCFKARRRFCWRSRRRSWLTQEHGNGCWRNGRSCARNTVV